MFRIVQCEVGWERPAWDSKFNGDVHFVSTDRFVVKDLLSNLLRVTLVQKSSRRREAKTNPGKLGHYLSPFCIATKRSRGRHKEVSFFFNVVAMSIVASTQNLFAGRAAVTRSIASSSAMRWLLFKWYVAVRL
jgi:hypothetical protein